MEMYLRVSIILKDHFQKKWNKVSFDKTFWDEKVSISRSETFMSTILLYCFNLEIE